MTNTPTLSPQGAIELPRASADGLDLAALAPVRSCSVCKGDGHGPSYGFASDDRSTCERCEGRCWERVPCVGCDAPSVYVDDGEPLCARCYERPWVGPRLTGSTDERLAMLLQYAAAAVLARRVVLPAIVRAGAMLAQGVARGPVTVDTTGEERAA